jgi:hypothetical protein
MELKPEDFKTLEALTDQKDLYPLVAAADGDNRTLVFIELGNLSIAKLCSLGAIFVHYAVSVPGKDKEPNKMHYYGMLINPGHSPVVSHQSSLHALAIQLALSYVKLFPLKNETVKV